MDIKRLPHFIAEFVREEVRSERDLWRRIPFLALQADGRKGFSQRYNTAYRFGYWTFPPLGRYGRNGICVDLDSAELVDDTNTKEIADDKSIIRLLAYTELLDVGEIIKTLEISSKEPIASYMKPKVDKNWHARMGIGLGLETIFSRKPLQIKQAG